MPKQNDYPPPKRKEPGFIGKLFSATIQAVAWLIVSLILSIIIEWVGMAWFWPEQGAGYARKVLEGDLIYLNQEFYDQSLTTKKRAIGLTQQTIGWIVEQSWPQSLVRRAGNESNSLISSLQDWLDYLYQRYRDYIQASGYVIQTFVVRLALIFFSLPTFIIAAFVGAADGLVERDLRRWGGGRESSNVFSIARKSVVPAFISACVIYVSLPFSLNPAVVMMPFALLLAIVVRVSFERLKKYL